MSVGTLTVIPAQAGTQDPYRYSVCPDSPLLRDSGSPLRLHPHFRADTDAMPAYCFLILLLVALTFFARTGNAFAGDATENSTTPPPKGENWLVWHTDDYFERCDGNCAVSIFGGQQVKTHMADIFIQDPSPPWDWKWGDSQFIGGAFSRRLLSLWHSIDIDPEIGLGKRFGDMHAEEVWAAIYFRWTRFPWNKYLRTTIAVSMGPSFAFDLPEGPHAAFVLNYFSPEITFALPQFSQYELLFQFHHRSNLGIGNGADPGWQYLTVGLRTRF